jgi:hypothetical protein
MENKEGNSFNEFLEQMRMDEERGLLPKGYSKQMEKKLGVKK